MKTIVTGATGLLGEEVADFLEGQEGHEVVRLRGRDDLDIVDTRSVVSFMCEEKPNLIVHCAAERDMDAAELDPKAACLLNTYGTWNVALTARLSDCPMVFISTEAVYDGEKGTPYTESDPTNPINVYGRSKAMAEDEVRSLLDKYFILRVPLLFGAKGGSEGNRVLNTVNALRNGQSVTAPADQWTSPTYTRDVAMAIARMTRTSQYGVYLVANRGKASRYEFACKMAELAGCDLSLVCSGKREGKSAKRMKNTALDCTRFEETFGIAFRPWEDALEECLESMGLCC